MTKKELIEKLNKMDIKDNAEIFCEKDLTLFNGALVTDKIKSIKLERTVITNNGTLEKITDKVILT